MSNYDTRRVLDYRFDQLSSSVTALDTTLQSAGFATLPSDLSAEKYIPVVLADDALKLYETVWITGHSAASQSVTVVRGREGSTARPWASGGLWRVAPTMRDVLSTVPTRAALPADAHIGMRAMIENEDLTVTRTALGWAGGLNGGPRRNLWNQGSAGMTNDAETVISGLTAAAGYQGGPATYNAGNVTLNVGGLWHLRLYVFHDATVAHSMQLIMRWTSGTGPWPGDEALKFYGPLGYAGAGLIQGALQWIGYVTDAQAATPLRLLARHISSNAAAATGIYWQFNAEHLGG